MRTSQKACLLRIFISEDDQARGRPLYEAVLEAARNHDVAGVTVLRGVLGYGAHKHIHAAKILRLSENLPMVIEIVDDQEKIAAFLPLLDTLIAEGMVTLEDIEVIAYRRDG